MGDGSNVVALFVSHGGNDVSETRGSSGVSGFAFGRG